jgi:hypothetical protein
MVNLRKIISFINHTGLIFTMTWGMSILLGNKTQYNINLFVFGVVVMVICQNIFNVMDYLDYRKNKKKHVVK